jgi:cytochrome c
MATPQGHFGFGSPATPEQIAGWDSAVAPDGVGLPPGGGTVQQGDALYARLGANCHGARGEGGDAPALVGGIGSLRPDAPLKTVGRDWPPAPVRYDDIQRAMPADNPQSLTPDAV